MAQRTRLAAAFLLGLGACGGSSDGDADAAAADADTTDAAPTEQLTADIDGTALCPGGWTVTEPSAVEEDAWNRIRITGACSSDNVEVEMMFAPIPAAPGGTAPCTQTTFRIKDGAHATCRVGSAALAEPTGELTLGTATPARVSGTCGCEFNDEGTPVIGSASFSLTLE